ncbi:MAG: arylesterase [Betaproteobacteria bacterium]|nr:arylesterase [Betaproteobacteria bacterium]
MNRRAALALALRTLALGTGGLAVGALPACNARKPIRGQPVAAGATVLALGDSLTHGTGATAEASYPAVLARLTGWRVVNAGVPGDTSAQALARAPAQLEEHRPALVLLCIGGNDFLRRADENDTRANLLRLVHVIRDSGAQLMLIAMPRPTLAARFTGSLTDHPMYGEVAEAERVPLHRQGFSEVLADERLKSDTIHANAAGYEQFARGLLATLRATGLFVG